jgi:hypothetical protein
MTKKLYVVPIADMNKLSPQGGCLVTDRITVDGMRIGFMYREKPINNEDSGWRFFAGDENDEYMANNDNHNVYQLSAIAEHDSDIMKFLDTPEGTEFERDYAGILNVALTH